MKKNSIYHILIKMNEILFEPIGKGQYFSAFFRRTSYFICYISLIFAGVILTEILNVSSSIIVVLILGGIMLFSQQKNQIGNGMGIVGGALAFYFASYAIDDISVICMNKWSSNLLLFYLSVVSVYITVVYFGCLIISILGEIFIDYTTFKANEYIAIFVNLITLLFIIMIFIPSETYFYNMSDFDLKYKYIIMFYMPRLYIYTLIGSGLIANLKVRLGDSFCTLTLGLCVATYIQYMFMNGLIRIVDGSSIEWDKHSVDIAVNLVIWCAVILMTFLYQKFCKKTWIKVRIFAPSMLLALHIISLVSIIVAGLPKEKKYMDAYLSSEEQFMVSGEGNIVVFVIDAADNDYIDELLKRGTDCFDELHDFTIYTNTCSVYDSTAPSIMTMMAGATFDNTVSADEWYHRAWTNEKTTGFYTRMHDAGYKIHYYNFYGGNPTEWIDKIDNSVAIEDVSFSSVDFTKMEKNMRTLVEYRVLPYYFKQNLDIQNIDFSGIVAVTPYALSKNRNEEFSRALDEIGLSVSDEKNPYLIYQHIRGVHEPCNDLVGTMEECLYIATKYINQMKELGVYDNSTIIITADHGRHDTTNENYDDIFASTPIFMIKEAGNINDAEIGFDDAPIYHEDIIPTILKNAGMYSENNIDDVKIFGTSIYMHSSGESRERIWYNRAREENGGDTKYSRYTTFQSSFNTWYAYKYTGTYDDLKRIVANGIIWKKYPIYEFFG